MTDKVLSANEIETLVLKAVRGGGVPLGHAEDLASAARFLDLDSLEHCPCRGPDAPVMALPRALDKVRIGDVPQVVEAGPALAAAYFAAFEDVTGQAVAWHEDGAHVVMTGMKDTDGPPSPLGRRSVPDDIFQHLTDQAALTLVPESEASRAVGAGAGLNDND